MRRTPDQDSFDEDPLPSDQDASDSVDLVACPYCGKMILDTAEVCPKCGSYISLEDQGATRKPRWLVLTAIVLLITFATGYLAV